MSGEPRHDIQPIYMRGILIRIKTKKMPLGLSTVSVSCSTSEGGVFLLSAFLLCVYCDKFSFQECFYTCCMRISRCCQLCDLLGSTCQERQDRYVVTLCFFERTQAQPVDNKTCHGSSYLCLDCVTLLSHMCFNSLGRAGLIFCSPVSC